MAVICKNCGFSNADGDEFCGNCGKYLEFSGVVAEEPQPAPPPPPGDGPAADAGAVGAPPPPPLDEGTTAMSVPPPPPPDSGAATPPPPPAGGSDQTQPGGRGPDVICWNCSRRNPGGRTFCIQCGERLAAGKPTSAVKTGAVAAAGGAGAGVAAGAGGPPPPPGSGPPWKVIGIGAGVVVALLVVAVVFASFLGGPGPTATPTSGSVITPKPSSSPVASGSSPVASASSPVPTGTAVTPSTSPTTPTDTATPSATPTTTPTKTPGDPNARCANVGNRGKQTVLFKEPGSEYDVVKNAWCIKSVVFGKGSGSGTLKLYLDNSKFDPSHYGWAEVQQPQGFDGSTFKWDNSIALPEGYDYIPVGTTILFQSTNHAKGSVTISYVPIRP